VADAAAKEAAEKAAATGDQPLADWEKDSIKEPTAEATSTETAGA
jgi:small subunit ribosomal protein S2